MQLRSNTHTNFGFGASSRRRIRHTRVGNRLFCNTNGCATILELDPSGTRLAIQIDGPEVWRVGVTGGDPTFVASGELLGFNADGSRILVVDSERYVRSVSAVNGTSALLFTVPHPVGASALSPDSRRLALVEEWDFVHPAPVWLFNLETNKALKIGEVIAPGAGAPVGSANGFANAGGNSTMRTSGRRSSRATAS